MADTGKDRARRYREGMRAAGLRQVQIWVADTRRAGFDEECARQARLVAAADRADAELTAFMVDALVDVLDGTRE